MNRYSDMGRDLTEVNLKKKTRIIPIENAEEGMVIACDVLNTSGKCLITAGTVLTAFIIKSLINQGILHISIQSDKNESESFSEEEILVAEEESVKRLKERFKEEPTDPMMKIIYDIALKIEMLEYLECKKD
ncbi:MAG: hypothetical protein ACPL1G_03580 [Thermodesulfovibrionales bacterium]